MLKQFLHWSFKKNRNFIFKEYSFFKIGMFEMNKIQIYIWVRNKIMFHKQRDKKEEIKAKTLSMIGRKLFLWK